MAVAPTPRRKSFFAHLIIGILTILVVFEAFSLACWLLIPVFPSVLLENENSVAVAILNAETGLFSSLQQLAPILLAILLVAGGFGLLRLVLSFFKKRPRLVLRLSSSKKGVNLLAGLQSFLDDVFDPAAQVQGVGCWSWLCPFSWFPASRFTFTCPV
jgi:AAA+ ATPase superfamily predicted ATPase